MKKQDIKKDCINYLGDRGITRDIKKCDIYKDMYFIIFKDYPDDVETSFITNYYEPYDEIPSNEMIWNKENYKKIYNRSK
tara:strand:+ start:335 stop:574 length:240 start_codon:yes stop_codon:yes gene_type:complete